MSVERPGDKRRTGVVLVLFIPLVGEVDVRVCSGDAVLEVGPDGNRRAVRRAGRLGRVARPLPEVVSGLHGRRLLACRRALAENAQRTFADLNRAVERRRVGQRERPRARLDETAVTENGREDRVGGVRCRVPLDGGVRTRNAQRHGRRTCARPNRALAQTHVGIGVRRH